VIPNKPKDTDLERIAKSVKARGERYVRRRAAENAEPIWGKCIGCDRQIPLLVFHLAMQSKKPLKCSGCGTAQEFPDYRSEGITVWMVCYDAFYAGTVERVIEREGNRLGISRYIRAIGDGFGFPVMAENLEALARAFDYSVGASHAHKPVSSRNLDRDGEVLSEEGWLEQSAQRIWKAAHLDLVSQIALLEHSNVPTIEL